MVKTWNNSGTDRLVKPLAAKPLISDRGLTDFDYVKLKILSGILRTFMLRDSGFNEGLMALRFEERHSRDSCMVTSVSRGTVAG